MKTIKVKTAKIIAFMFSVFTILFFFVWVDQVFCSETIEKNGDCPPGWSTSGKYCVPGKYAKYIIEKKNECPVGFRTAGKYCIKTGK